MKLNKYIYLYVLQANYGYGHGWEDETAETSWKEMRERRKEYRENAPQYAYRVIRRREVNPEFARMEQVAK